MTPETKAWIEEVKKMYSEEYDYPITNNFEAYARHLPKALQVIESQEKEIERLKAQLKEGIEIMRAAGGFFEKIIGNENQKIKV